MLCPARHFTLHETTFLWDICTSLPLPPETAVRDSRGVRCPALVTDLSEHP